LEINGNLEQREFWGPQDDEYVINVSWDAMTRNLKVMYCF
jgi:hypothetical protein